MAGAGTQPAGKPIIISGPSGAGKSTVVRRLMQECPLPLVLSVSATTRSPRPGEEEGVDYYFLQPSEFARRREGNDFLECKQVFGQQWYGTLREEVTAGLNRGKWVILEIDVEGTLSVLEQMPDAVTIFIHPGSPEELEQRLRDRATEPEEAIQRRLAVARREMTYKHHYRHEIINDSVSRAVAEICNILTRYMEN